MREEGAHVTDSRNKGKAYENYIAKLFREAGWSSAKRHLEYQAEEAVEGRDLDGTEPFAIQTKCWKKAPPITTILEVDPDGNYIFPVAILKRTRSYSVPNIVGALRVKIPTLEVAVVDLNIFMQMLSLLKEYRLLEFLE